MTQVNPVGSKPLFKQWRFVPVLCLIALMMAGNGMVTPILSILAQQFGVGGLLLGLVFTLFGFGRIAATVPTGLLSERFGRRPFMIGGPALLLLGSLGAVLYRDFYWLVLCRFVQGFGAGVYMTVSAVVVAEMSSKADRGRSMALYQGALLFGAGIGPTAGGYLYAVGGYEGPFWGYALVAALATTVAVFWFQEPTARAKGSPANIKGSFAQLSGQFAFLFLCLTNFGVFLTRAMSHWVLIPLIAVERHGLSPVEVGYAFTAMAIANAMMLPIVGPAIDHFGSRWLSIISTCGTGLSLFMLGAAPGGVTFWIGILATGLFAGINGPAVGASIIEQIPPGMFGPAVGFQRLVSDFGLVVGPMLGGAFYGWTLMGAAGGLFANAALMITAGIGIAIVLRK